MPQPTVSRLKLISGDATLIHTLHVSTLLIRIVRRRSAAMLPWLLVETRPLDSFIRISAVTASRRLGELPLRRYNTLSEPYSFTTRAASLSHISLMPHSQTISREARHFTFE